MKKGRFLWSAYRITERWKTGKARNIKGKQLKNSRNTVSKQHVVHHSSASDNRLLRLYQNGSKPRKIKVFRGFLIPKRVTKVCPYLTKREPFSPNFQWLNIGQPESNFGSIFEGEFGTLRHLIFRWRVWHNLTKSEQLNTILMQALSNK